MRSIGEVKIVVKRNKISERTNTSDDEFYYKQPFSEQKNKEKLVFYSVFSYL